MENLTDRCKQIILRDLPPLYQDAVQIARRLAYRYLWVDSLCILQDSSTDWVAESAEMGGIYRNAVLNISADASPDPDCGIFESANSQRTPVVLLNLSCRSSIDRIEGLVAINSDSHWRKIENPLQERAWVLQENMFSPRKLHYAADEISWSCETTRHCQESDPAMNAKAGHFTGPHSVFQMPYWTHQHGVKSLLGDADTVGCTALTLWYEKIHDYAARRITFNSDRFPAIAGLAKEVAAHTGYQYKAGLWLEDVHAGLLWNAPRVGVDARHAPTWSWAVIENRQHKLEKYGVNGVQANWPVMNDRNRAHIVEIHVKNVNDDPLAKSNQHI